MGSDTLHKPRSLPIVGRFGVRHFLNPASKKSSSNNITFLLLLTLFSTFIFVNLHSIYFNIRLKFSRIPSFSSSSWAPSNVYNSIFLHNHYPNDSPAYRDPHAFINWRYSDIIARNITEHTVVLGTEPFNDEISIYKPICMTKEKKFYTFKGLKSCSGFNKSTSYFKRQCPRLRYFSKMATRLAINIDKEEKDFGWIYNNKQHIQWIDDLTIIQGIEPTDSNVAHVIRRFLFIHHIRENLNLYTTSKAMYPLNILILPSTNFLVERFRNAYRYNFYHQQLLNVVAYPYQHEIGNLYDFTVSATRKGSRRKRITAHVLSNYSFINNNVNRKPNFKIQNKSFVCFRKALIPGYLNQRFFINDFEYPSFHLKNDSPRPAKQNSSSTRTQGMMRLKRNKNKFVQIPYLPRDSVKFRQRLRRFFNAYNGVELNNEPSAKLHSIYNRKKQLILLDRSGQSRTFEHETKMKLIQIFKLFAMHNGFSFSMLDADYLSFQQQYEILKYKTIAIGIHGANLANCIFMPPYSVLFEIFPHAFSHQMYMHGGNSGLFYKSYMMLTAPTDYKGLQLYNYSTSQCTKLNGKCNGHYKNQQLVATAQDYFNIKHILSEVFDIANSLKYSST